MHKLKNEKCKGLKGVSYSTKSDRFIARITLDKIQIFLGTCSTPEEAHEAYNVAIAKGPEEARRMILARKIDRLRKYGTRW